MTKVVFVRHAQPDYTQVAQRAFIGHGRDLAPLTAAGAKAAGDICADKRLAGAQLIVASPYTRALQTAAIISKNLRLNISVELDLHEWLPDLSFRFATAQEASKALKLCAANKGVCPKHCEMIFEDLEMVFNRVKNCLLNYRQYSKIIAVTHGTVMQQFAAAANTPFCDIKEISLDEDLQWGGFAQ